MMRPVSVLLAVSIMAWQATAIVPTARLPYRSLRTALLAERLKAERQRAPGKAAVLEEAGERPDLSSALWTGVRPLAGRCGRSVMCMQIDDDAARQQRIDAALEELARSGDQTRAAVAGGMSAPREQQLESYLPPPSWLSTAPPLIGGFSILLFVLNIYGVFGEGPDLDALNKW